MGRGAGALGYCLFDNDNVMPNNDMPFIDKKGKQFAGYPISQLAVDHPYTVRPYQHLAQDCTKHKDKPMYSGSNDIGLGINLVSYLPQMSVLALGNGAFVVCLLGPVSTRGAGSGSLCSFKYKYSTLSRAHWVLRKNFRLDLILGS